jgi:hypothetical protein
MRIGSNEEFESAKARREIKSFVESESEIEEEANEKN